MVFLTPDLHHSLEVEKIELLKRNNISTVVEFLRADSKHLRKILNINDLTEVDNIKKTLFKTSGIVPIDGFTHYQQLLHQPILSTGITSLDDMLNGGLLPGNLIDLCGLSGCGKTQLHTTIALNLAMNQHLDTFVIDTKGDFSGERIHRMLLHRKVNDATKRKEIMQQIKVEKCTDPIQLINLITALIDKANSFAKFKILVIDSLPALWFLYHGNKNSVGHRNLPKLANLLRKLAVECGIVVLTVNIVTRWMNQSTTGEQTPNDDQDSILNDSMSLTPPTDNETAVPALGKYWQSICSLRLLIQRSTINQRIIRILKSNHLKSGSKCVVQLTDGGVS